MYYDSFFFYRSMFLIIFNISSVDPGHHITRKVYKNRIIYLIDTAFGLISHLTYDVKQMECTFVQSNVTWTP